MAEWKPERGKPAMVFVEEIPSDLAVLLTGPISSRTTRLINAGCLHPLPRDVTPEAQAVLDAAVNYVAKWRQVGTNDFSLYRQSHAALIAAVDAHLASIAPPDPVKEFREAMDNLQEYITPRGCVSIDTDSPSWARLLRAIAALEAK